MISLEDCELSWSCCARVGQVCRSSAQILNHILAVKCVAEMRGFDGRSTAVKVAKTGTLKLTPRGCKSGKMSKIVKKVEW